MKISDKETFVIIGLCGRSGAGKTTVCSEFEKLGIMAIDTDKVYRGLVSPKCDGAPSELVLKLSEAFGKDIIKRDGSLDRRVLAGYVFGEGNEEKLDTLNRLTHTPILDKTEELTEKYRTDGARGVIIDAPALFESGFDKKCDAVVCVTAPEDVLVHRIVNRDGITEDAARRRLSSQISENELRYRTDHVIVNDGFADVSSQVRDIVSKIFD